MATPRLIDAPRRLRDARRRSHPRQGDGDGLDADTLKAVQHSVSEALRRQCGLSPNLAVETAGEMVNEAYAEYAEKTAPEKAQVRNLPGLLVTTAIHRAIDKGRKEGRELRGEAAEAAIDGAVDPSASTELLAVRGIEAAELFEAVAELHHEQRTALVLLYWEELSLRDAASRAGVGKMTISRRRDDAMAALRPRFGIGADDPITEHLGRVAGHHAWTALVVGPAATHAAAPAVAEHVAAGASVIRQGAGDAWKGVADLAGRGRDLAARLIGSGGGDQLGRAVASGSTGGVTKAIGVCAGAIAICGAAGVAGVGPGAALFEQHSSTVERPAREAAPHPPRSAPETSHEPPVRNAPLGAATAQPSASRTARGGGRAAHRRPTHRTDANGKNYSPAAERAVSSQTLSGETEPAPTESTPQEVPEEPSEPYVGEPGSGGESAATAAATEQFSP